MRSIHAADRKSTARRCDPCRSARRTGRLGSALGARLWPKLRLALGDDDRAVLLVGVVELCVASSEEASTAYSHVDPVAVASLIAGVVLNTRPGGPERIAELCGDDPRLATLRTRIETRVHAALSAPAGTPNPFAQQWNAIRERVGVFGREFKDTPP